MANAPTPYVLPTPCATCGGPVTYRGRGPKPKVCGPACKAARDAASRPDRRALVSDEETYDPAWLAAIREQDERMAASKVERARADLGGSLADDPSWEHASVPVDYRFNVRPRAKDPAAQWLAENFPEALADFPEDLR